MIVTGPPAAGRPGAGPRLCRAEHRVFDGASSLARDPALRTYLTDLAGRQGLPVREEVFATGAGQSYTEMALPLIKSVTSLDAPVDLLVLAYGVHDVQPGRNVALHLASRCPGEPLAFAVTDQGPAAAFAGLRVIGDYVATGGTARALLLVAEQAALHYPPAAPGPVPDRHAMAALLFEVDTDAPPVRVRQHAGVPAEAVGAVLAAEVAELAGGRADVLLVAGHGVELEPGTAAAVREVRRAPAGLPFTGLWSRLCETPGERSGEPGRGRPVLLADHDPVLGYLSVAALRWGATSTETSTETATETAAETPDEVPALARPVPASG
ncbi:hypothetical protein [Actinophytocola sp.]|uniref:hypothetical protein n=1 Tax=Actinophytocola sp. TaxID=1872138 RepID=UPI003D6BABCD